MNPVEPWSCAGLRGRRAGSYLTIPAAFPRALAWAYRFLATVFSFTEPTNTIPFTFLLTDRRQDAARTRGDPRGRSGTGAHMVKLVMKARLGICTLKPML